MLAQWTSKVCSFHISKIYFGVQIHFNRVCEMTHTSLTVISLETSWTITGVGSLEVGAGGPIHAGGGVTEVHGSATCVPLPPVGTHADKLVHKGSLKADSAVLAWPTQAGINFWCRNTIYKVLSDSWKITI